MIYLTGASGPLINRLALQLGVGLLLQPTNRSQAAIPRYPCWAADNGCFAAGEHFELDAFYGWLKRLSEYAATCLFASAPDVVADAAATLQRSTPVLPALRKLGYRAALVAQDGIRPADVPWDAIDCLFIGGSTAWKLSAHVPPLVRAAKAEGKWVHMGRVNSYRRLRAAALIGCDSADGTFLKFAPDVNVPRLRVWIERLRDQRALPLYEQNS